MAISINWSTKVITVPRNDMTLIQSNPSEIRELNLNQFRLNLKDLEDDEVGMVYLDTHQHNGEVLLGGIVYARVIEIINGYTVTFEDGQYSVNLVGANSNVGDVINLNQVSVRSSNSAGLISNAAIEFSSFNGGITIDVDNITGRAKAGTTFPTGTDRQPVNNLDDLYLIATTRGFNKVYIKGDLTVSDSNPWEGFTFQGESQIKSLISIDDSADVFNCEFKSATITGVLDGTTQIEDSIITGLDFIDGYIKNSSLGNANVELGTSTTATFFNCHSTIPGTSTPVIDMNSTGILSLRDYYGGVKLINYSGNGEHSVDLSSGKVILDDTFSGGTLVIRGIGRLVDKNSNTIDSGTWNGVTIINELVNPENINEEVLEFFNADEVKESDGTLTRYKSGTAIVLGDVKTISEDCNTGDASIIKKI